MRRDLWRMRGECCDGVRRVQSGQRAVRGGFRQGGSPDAAGPRGRGRDLYGREVAPREVFGLEVGEAHVIRNAGGRVSDDAIRSLVISERLLGTNEVVVIHHTD
jgi:carbonic anhydrase